MGRLRSRLKGLRLKAERNKGNVMGKKQDRTMKTTEERRREAEELLRTTKREVATMPFADVQQLVHELQVHQIELDMQNDELHRTRIELEAARDRYADLYDFSPAGYLTLDMQSRVVEANLRAGTLLRVNRKELIGSRLMPIIARDHQDTFHRHCQDVLKTGMRQTCDVKLREDAGVAHWIHFESLAVHNEPGHITHWRTALLDISDRKRAEQELATQRSQLEGIIGSAMDAIITVDEEEQVVLFNRAAESMFLCQSANAIGQPLNRFIPERFRGAHQGNMSILALTQTTSRSMGGPDTLFGLRADGEGFPLEESISHVTVDGKKFFTVIVRDITERRQAEEALRDREHEFHLLADNVPAFYAYVDCELRYRFVNKRYEELFGRPASEMLGRPVKDVVGELNFDKLEPHLREAVAGQATSFIYPMTLPNGDARWINVHYTPDVDGTGLTRGVLVLASDVTAQAQAELALKQSQLGLMEKREELQALAEKLLTAQDEERKRIARELHDDFNQRLAALSVELESMERAPISPPEPVVQQLAAVRSQVVQLSDDLHNMAYRLHPSLLDHVGLEMALRDHVAEFTKRTGLPVRFDTHKVPRTLSKEIATNLFRVMQESLQNVSKHAEATNVTVRLTASSKGVGLSVRDNGKGFDLERQKDCVSGLGLVSMQERARGLGGFLRIHSLPENGTKVCAWIPHLQEGG